MTDRTDILQNDPNEGLRLRLEPEEDDGSPRSSRDTLILALHDLHQVAREKLEAPEPGRRAKRHRHRSR